MAEPRKPRFSITGGKIEVRDLSTSKLVDRPDIAAKGIAAFTQAIEAAGGELESPVTINGAVSYPRLTLVSDDEDD